MARFGALPASLLGLLLVATCAKRSHATGVLDEQFFDDDNQLVPAVNKRAACGYYGTLTCSEGQYCYTDPNNGWALCGWTSPTAIAQAGATSYQMYTTTYLETDLRTVTSTYSVAVATGTSASGCRASLGETQCGSGCCQAGEFCVEGENYCAGTGGGSSGFYSSFYTASASPPVRGTTIVGITVTSTGSVTATRTTHFGTPVPTGGSTVGVSAGSSSGGLSGGAIAGIVIAVIVGLLLLLLLILCCCAKGALDAILACLGLRKRERRRTEEVRIEERHTHRHHDGAVAAAPARRTWFGTRPSRTTEVIEEKKTSRFGGAAGVTAGLVGLAALLGLKRRHDRRDDKSRYTGTGSDYSYSYYTYSDTSASSESSDRRTRDTRRSSRHGGSRR